MAGIRLTEKEQFIILELFNQNKTAAEIARIIGKSSSTIRGFLKRKNIQLRPRWEPVPENLKKEIITLYQKGFSTYQIEKNYPYSRELIRRILKDNNINRKNSGFYIKFPLNEDFFEEINTEEKAYILGFICADGNVDSRNRINITLHQDDLDHLYKIAKLLSPEYKKENILIGETLDSRNQHIRKWASISFTSKKMIEDLKNYNIVPRKSLILKPPITIPNHLIRHWIRGVFDGDGSFGHSSLKSSNQYSFCIVGTLEMMEFISNVIFKNLNIKVKFRQKTYAIKNNKNTYEIWLDREQDIFEVGDWLFFNSTLFLNRKKIILDQLRLKLIDKKIKRIHLIDKVEKQVKKYLPIKIKRNIISVKEQILILQELDNNVSFREIYLHKKIISRYKLVTFINYCLLE